MRVGSVSSLDCIFVVGLGGFNRGVFGKPSIIVVAIEPEMGCGKIPESGKRGKPFRGDLGQFEHAEAFAERLKEAEIEHKKQNWQDNQVFEEDPQELEHISV